MNLSANHSRGLRVGIPLVLLSPLMSAHLGAPYGIGSQESEPRVAAGETRGERSDSGRVLRLSLQDALRIALERNLGLEAEMLTTEIAELDALGSWGSFDPVLSVTGTASENERQGQTQLAGGAVVRDEQLSVNTSLALPLTTGGNLSLSWNHSNDETNNQFAVFDISTTDVLTLQLTQPLLRGGWSRYATSQQRQQEIALQRQRQSEKVVRQRLQLDVSSAYWDLVSALEELRVRTLAVERGEKQLEQDRRRLDLGAGTEVDVLQSETNVAQQSELLLNAQFQLRQSEDTLRNLLFQKLEGSVAEYLDEWDWPIEPLTALPKVRPATLDWRASLQAAFENRPELSQLRLDIDSSNLTLDLADSEWWPQLDLDLSTSSTGFDPDPDESLNTALDRDFPNSSASLTFSLPLFNRAGRHGLRSARASYRRAQLSFDQLELQILTEVRTAVRDVQYRAEAVAAATKSAALAKRQLEAEQVRMEIGLSTTFQVLEFQETLAEARSTEVAARAAYAKSLVALAHSEGRLKFDPDAEAGDS